MHIGFCKKKWEIFIYIYTSRGSRQLCAYIFTWTKDKIQHLIYLLITSSNLSLPPFLHFLYLSYNTCFPILYIYLHLLTFLFLLFFHFLYFPSIPILFPYIFTYIFSPSLPLPFISFTFPSISFFLPFALAFHTLPASKTTLSSASSSYNNTYKCFTMKSLVIWS